MTTPHAVPEAWPQLLSREQLCAYLGGLSWDTIKKVLPVAPLDLGANVYRYARPEVDAWIARLPPRLPKALQPDGEGRQGEPPAAHADLKTVDRPSAAALRARERAARGPKSCRRSASSSASAAPMEA